MNCDRAQLGSGTGRGELRGAGMWLGAGALRWPWEGLASIPSGAENKTDALVGGVRQTRSPLWACPGSRAGGG